MRFFNSSVENCLWRRRSDNLGIIRKTLCTVPPKPKFDREFLIEEYKKNLQVYEMEKIGYAANDGRWIGISNQKVVAHGFNKYEIQKLTLEECKKWAGGELPDLIPTVVLQVGHEDDEPFVFGIEKDPPLNNSDQQVAFMASNKSLMCWGHTIAKPALNEQKEDYTLDRNFHKFRFISSEFRPYVTCAVSYTIDSPPFLMTFLIDTGSPVNWIKGSVFNNMKGKIQIKTGAKVLFINGVELEFYEAQPKSVHSNVSILGTPTFLVTTFLEELGKAYHQKIEYEL